MIKIKAFTLLEMIINLTLMSIIVSMIYVVYAYFSKNVYEYSKTSSENFAVQSFYAQLKEDFFYSDKIISENGKDFTVVFYNDEFIQYKVHKNYLFRKAKRSKDSIKTKSVQLDFLENEDPNKEEHLITGIKIKSILYKKETPLRVYKNYFSNYLILEE